MMILKNIAAALATAGFATGLGSVTAHSETGDNIALIMDASGSMTAKTSDGTPRIQAAKTAIAEFTKRFPTDANISFRAYGHQSHRSEKNCKDTRMLVPFGKIANVSQQIINASNGLQAQGYTPISYVLGLAAQDLAPLEGTKTVILVSDGKETCDGDPCVVAKNLADQNIDLVINTVGLGVDSQTRQQLQCIARVSRGNYYDASNADELSNSMQQAAVAKEKVRKKIKVNATTGKLELVGKSWNNINVLDAETGKKVGDLHQVSPILKLPAGLYNLQFKDGLIQKSVQILAGEATKVEPAQVKLQMPDTILYYILDSETGELLGDINGYSNNPDTVPAGRYDFAIGQDKKMLVSADLKEGELFEVPVGRLQIVGKHWEVVIKDPETDEKLLGSAWNDPKVTMLPGKYNYGVGVKYQLNIPFEIKSGETTQFSPGGVKVVPNGDYKIMSSDGEHIADHNSLVGQTFLPDGDYSVLIGTTAVPVEIRDGQMVEIEVV